VLKEGEIHNLPLYANTPCLRENRAHANIRHLKGVLLWLLNLALGAVKRHTTQFMGYEI